jgi:proteasome lid subunit RPN8/RPN11
MGIERVGFVLQDGSLIEVPNISPHPENSFMVRGEDIMKYALSGEAQATWHTHPVKDGNLTIEDHEMFLNYPELEHYIVGNDGVRRYSVKDGRVINA